MVGTTAAAGLQALCAGGRKSQGLKACPDIAALVPRPEGGLGYQTKTA
jgi:hypothetical protein